MLPDVGPGLDGELLVFAVDGRVHAVEEHAVDILGQQGVPARAPDHLDHVPARPSVEGLELLDDLAVATDRSVESLQVAVDDEDQVVEMLPAGDAQRADRLGLVHLAVADEAPDPAVAGVDQVTKVEVPVDVRLVDGRDGPEPHGDGGELPEVRHRSRVRVARQAIAADLVTEIIELGLRQAPLEERARHRCPATHALG